MAIKNRGNTCSNIGVIVYAEMEDDRGRAFVAKVMVKDSVYKVVEYLAGNIPVDKPLVIEVGC